MNTATAGNTIMYTVDAQNFQKVPGNPIAYWVGQVLFNVFADSASLSSVGDSRQGLITGNNDRFLRCWYEIDLCKISCFNGSEWFPYNKGGEFRKWFGNNILVVNWKNDGYDIKNYKDEKGKLLSRPQNVQYYGKESITWTALTSGIFNGRYSPEGYMFDAKGSSYFVKTETVWNILSYLNSCVANYILSVTAPTLDFNAGVVAKLPYKRVEEKQVEELAIKNTNIARVDWDSFETSWNFKKHPLI